MLDLTLKKMLCIEYEARIKADNLVKDLATIDAKVNPKVNNEDSKDYAVKACPWEKGMAISSPSVMYNLAEYQQDNNGKIEDLRRRFAGPATVGESGQDEMDID